MYVLPALRVGDRPRLPERCDLRNLPQKLVDLFFRKPVPLPARRTEEDRPVLRQKVHREREVDLSPEHQVENSRRRRGVIPRQKPADENVRVDDDRSGQPACFRRPPRTARVSRSERRIASASVIAARRRAAATSSPALCRVLMP